MSKTLPKAVQDQLGGAESLREAELFHRLEAAGLPAFYTQVQLIPGRKFRFDFAWCPELKVAVELQGGIHTRGRHTRGKGYEADAVKSAMAQALGWMVLYVTPGQVRSGVALELITSALRSRGWTEGVQ